jgi:putative salt-induced outer membrane protein YdiY
MTFRRLLFRSSFLALGPLALAGIATPVAAQDDEDPARTRWVAQAELTTVLSQGNSESFTAGLGAVLRRQWEKDGLRFEFGAIRTESSRITRQAVGTPTDFEVQKISNSEKTAESLFARGRYDRSITETFFGYTAVDWLRNTFAGIDSRTLFALGAGNTWFDSDEARFKTTLAVTYTTQEDVVKDPTAKSSFAGGRVGYEYWNQLTGSAEFESNLVVDLNFDTTDDVRFDLVNSLAVNISDRLALKPSLQLLYRNRPSLTEVDLLTSGGIETGDTVLAELEKLDTFFRLALVLKL